MNQATKLFKGLGNVTIATTKMALFVIFFKQILFLYFALLAVIYFLNYCDGL